MPEQPSPAPSDQSADGSDGNGDDTAFADDLSIEAAATGDDRPVDERLEEALAEGPAPADAIGSTDVGATEVAATQPADEGDIFLAELTKAMQASAAAERDRANAEIDRRRLEHLTGIETRRKSEVDEMTALADQDLRAIDAWAEGERRRIDRERETRAAAVREDLQASLTEHGSRIDHEVEAVEAAISAHRTNVEAFFAELDSETEPVAIALQARRRPTFPSLTDLPLDGSAVADEAAAPQLQAVQAETEDVAPDPEPVASEEESGVAVMATDAAPAPTAWNPWANITDAENDDLAEPVAATAESTTDDGPERLEAVAVTSSASKPVESSVLQTVKVSRPLSWLRRDPDQDQG